jgi:hypothetical protein
MRTMARYYFEAPVSSQSGRDLLDRARNLVEAWLAGKGPRREEGDVATILYPDGRRAALSVGDVALGADREALRWELEEPLPQGRFATRLSIAAVDSRIEFSAHLRAGQSVDRLAPLSVDVRCPRIVRAVIDMGVPWHARSTLVRTRAVRSFSEAAGQELAEQIRDQGRGLPLIIVSEKDRLPLHPRLSANIASDLAGLAVVYEATAEASWALTRVLGKEWSCFDGAIRVYWPFGTDPPGDPRLHPLWTVDKLLHESLDVIEAAERIRQQLRRRVLAVSAFAFQAEDPFDQLRDLREKHDADERRKVASTDSEWRTLLEQENVKLTAKIHRVEIENMELRSENGKLGEEVAAYRQRAENAELALRYSAPAEATVTPGEPEPEETFESLDDAVHEAQGSFSDELVFGAEADAKVASLNPNAGPPKKVFRYLRGLAQLVLEKRKGPLGCSDWEWLKAKNVKAAPESDTIRNNAGEMRRRRFHDGKGPRQFDTHLKVSDNTSPQNCVRIYFDWDEESQRVIVGYVGPDL